MSGDQEGGVVLDGVLPALWANSCFGSSANMRELSHISSCYLSDRMAEKRTLRCFGVSN